jgi:ribosomal protein S12 methylthiotransferase accessory factor
MDIPLERAFPLEVALSNLTRDLHKIGLSFASETVGKFISSTKCTLLCDSGPVDFGYGKGTEKSCIAGAAFEAAEHYFSQPKHIDASSIDHLRAGDFIGNTPLIMTRALEVLKENARETLPFRRYQALNTPHNAHLPLALSCPKYIDALFDNPGGLLDDQFDYKSLQRYCTNSGVAIGSTEEEAIIHGLLETIERDTFSKFLVSTFLSPERHKIRLVDITTLPDHVRHTLKSVSDEVQGRVMLVELRNDYGVPVFLSSLADSPFPIDVTGFGASLSREHAALRSLYELVQCFHVTTKFHPESVHSRDTQVLSNLSRHPLHLKCAGLKLANHCRKYGFDRVDFSDTPDPHWAYSVPEYLEKLLTILSKNDVGAFFTTIVSLPSGITVTHSFIDGQEHFFCVTEGALVLPNETSLKSLC